MPWKSCSIMQSRQEFVRLAQQGDVSIAELCRRFGISRQTGHIYLSRHRDQGAEGLTDRSRRPRNSPRQCLAAMEAQVVELRRAHPAWGGRKLARRLRDLGAQHVPAPSTITAILRRHGLLDPAEAAKHTAFRRFERSRPNQLWQMDFKGHIAIDSGRCHPLTVLDDHCRYSLGLAACGDETGLTVRTHLTAIFQHYGMPEAMLSDNGSPWGGRGLGEYTALEVWLMRLGVRLYHGRPYHPQTQGKDERFHRTLDVEVLQARRFADLVHCQRAFDAWRVIYNEQRPHEALGLAVPASRYSASSISFPSHLPEPEYDENDLIRRVRHDGYVSFKGRKVKLSEAFAGLRVGFRPTVVDGVWKAFFMRFNVAKLDLRGAETHSQTVRDVSEHLSGMSEVAPYWWTVCWVAG
jgi:transposase InsO family protein